MILITKEGIWTRPNLSLTKRICLRAGIISCRICQNLYLSAEAIECGACAIICFGDEKLNNLVGVDGAEQLVIYIATVGKKPE